MSEQYNNAKFKSPYGNAIESIASSTKISTQKKSLITTNVIANIYLQLEKALKTLYSSTVIYDSPNIAANEWGIGKTGYKLLSSGNDDWHNILWLYPKNQSHIECVFSFKFMEILKNNKNYIELNKILEDKELIGNFLNYEVIYREFKTTGLWIYIKITDSKHIKEIIELIQELMILY